MKVFLTDDTGLAAFLYLKGIEILPGTVKNKEHYKRRFFVFYYSDEAVYLKKQYYNRTPMFITPLEYTEARTAISKYLKTNLDTARYSSLLK